MLDLIIPVYNEGNGLIAVLERIEANIHTPHRIFICYDHEQDTSLIALKNSPLKKNAIVPIKNTGSGAHGAIQTGLTASTAPFVVVYPADDLENSVIIDKMVQKAAEGCDIVAASRFIPGGCMQGAPWFKALVVRTVAWTLHHLAGIPVHDGTNGFRLFSRRVIDSIPLESSKGFTYSLEYLVKAHRKGWKMGEVPSRWIERNSGQSRFRFLRWAVPYARWYLYAFATTYNPLIRLPRVLAGTEKP